MMADFKTVEGQSAFSDPLLKKQNEDVAKMRASLLACSDNPETATYAIKNITMLRVYHQIGRIIRYLEMMDRIEEKLYQSIDYAIESAPVENPTTWMMLMNIQERLQRAMLDSHKLLQPYLNVEEFGIADLVVSAQPVGTSSAESLLSKDSRDKLRLSAQQVLLALESSENNND